MNLQALESHPKMPNRFEINALRGVLHKLQRHFINVCHVMLDTRLPLRFSHVR